MTSDFERALRATLGFTEPNSYWVTVPSVTAQTEAIHNPVVAETPRQAAERAQQQVRNAGLPSNWYYNAYESDPRVGDYAGCELADCGEDAAGYLSDFELHDEEEDE